MTGPHSKIALRHESGSMFLGTSRARMKSMLRENRVRSSSCVTEDYAYAEEYACDDVASDIYFSHVLAAAERVGEPMRAVRLQIGGTDIETVARFAAENDEDDLFRVERELPEESRMRAAETSYDTAASLHSRERALVENRPVILILDGGRIRSRGYLSASAGWKLRADIHPLDDVLLGVVDVPLGMFARWKELPMCEFLADRAPHMFPEWR
jgi:hypothetical protein